MSITRQYFRHLPGPSPRRAGPSAPGAHDWQARELRDLRRFRAVVAGRPAHGRIRRALGRRLRGRRPQPGC